MAVCQRPGKRDTPAPSREGLRWPLDQVPEQKVLPPEQIICPGWKPSLPLSRLPIERSGQCGSLTTRHSAL